MADQAALEMIARIRDEATPILKNLQREMDRLGRGPHVRDVTTRFAELNSTMSKLGGEMKNVLSPAIGAIGLSSLSAGAAVGIMISKLKSMGEGAVKFKYLEQVTGTSADKMSTIAHAAERLGIDSETTVSSYENFGRIVSDMTAGPHKVMVGQAREILETLRDSGTFGRELANSMRAFTLAHPKDTIGAFNLLFDKIATRSPEEQSRLAELFKFSRQMIGFNKILAAEKPSGIKASDIEMMIQYNNAMLNLEHSASKLWKTLALKVEPFFELQLKAADFFLRTLDGIENKLGKIFDWKRLLTGGIDIFGTTDWIKRQLSGEDHMPSPSGPAGAAPTGNNSGWPVAKPVPVVPAPTPVVPPPRASAPGEEARGTAAPGLSPRNTFRRFDYGGPDVFSSGQTPGRNEAIAAELLERGRKRFLEMQNEGEQRRREELIKVVPAPKPIEPPAAAPATRQVAPGAPTHESFMGMWDDIQERLTTAPKRPEGEQQRTMEKMLEHMSREPRIELPPQQPEKMRLQFEMPPRPVMPPMPRAEGPDIWAAAVARADKAKQDQQSGDMFPSVPNWRRLDRSLANQTGAVRIEGGADISVNVVAPKGTNVDASANGMFNPPSINRSQQMGFANPNGEQPFTGGNGAW